MLPDAILTRLQLALALHRGHGPADLRALLTDAPTILGQPDDPTALQQRLGQANAQMQQGNWPAALQSINDILRFTPRSVDAHVNRAAVLDHLGQSQAAMDSVATALSIDPNHALARRNRAAMLHRHGRWDDAVAELDEVLRRNPGDADALLQRSVSRYALGDARAALADGEAASALRPDHVPTLANLAVLLETEDDLDAAVRSCERALAIDPDHLDALLNYAVVLGRQRRWAEALACLDRVATARPQDANADYNASLIHLALGAYDIGWRLHEARWRTPHLAAATRGFAQPQWRGEPIPPGQTILLHAEQGLGDTLQFCRYVPLVAQQADTVLEVPRSLHRLLSGLPGVRTTVIQGEPLPHFDLHCPLMSLPLAFGTTPEEFHADWKRPHGVSNRRQSCESRNPRYNHPAEDLGSCFRRNDEGVANSGGSSQRGAASDKVPAATPYLSVAAKSVQAWRRRLKPLPGRRIGLVWAGRARSTNAALCAIDRRRSMALADFGPLATVPDVSFVSLQKGPDAAQTRHPPAGLTIADWTDELHDFADTASLVAALDLVITVDTAVAHLAGALGKQVWILNRHDSCWRWLTDRIDSPWYPTARLFRQPAPGDWASVIGEVVQALRTLRRQPRRTRTKDAADA